MTESHASGQEADSTSPVHITYAEENVIPKADRHKVIGDCPESDVTIGNIKIRCLIDSGSQVTTITETCYNQLFKNKKLNDSTWIKLSGSNGLPIPTVGIFITTLSIDRSTFNNIYILVVRDPVDQLVQQRKLDVPGVIGCNVISKMHGSKQQTHSPALSQALQRYESQLVLAERISATISDDNMCILGKVKTSVNGICIPANTEISITGTTNQSFHDCTVLVEAADVSVPEGLVIIPSVDKIRQGTIRCRVMNFSNCDLNLNKPTQIAQVTTCEVLCPNIDVTATDEGGVLISIDNQDQQNAMLDFDKSKMTKREQRQINKLFSDYNDIFSVDRNDLGYTERVEHHIHTTTDIPVKQPDRRIPPNIIPEVKKTIEDWLKSGVIQESESPYASQMVLVRKRSGDLRVCVDYRSLNNITVKDAYPLPRIEECIDALKGAKYFSSLDLTQGYLQVKVADADKPKTAFRAMGSLYEFCRLPFGLCNSPATFSRLMAKCLGHMNGKGIIIYLDDIMVYSSTISEMSERLAAVFQRIREFGLKLKPEKCHFMKRKVSFLGHVISSSGVETDPSKTTAISRYPVPETEHTVRQFLGLASYYRRFVKNFAQIAGPLTQLLQTGTRQRLKRNKKASVKDKWTPECTSAFECLKQKLLSSPILGFPDFNESFLLEVDASLQGFGAILSQKQDGKTTVIAYASRRLRKHERSMRNYSSMKLEFLCLHWAVTKKFRDYLYGTSSPFLVKTDSHPLSRILTTKHTAADMSKLADFLVILSTVRKSMFLSMKPA